MDYYKVLGISENVKESELKKVYRSLVRQYHPDLHKEHKEIYEEKMKQVNLAYEYVLKQLQDENVEEEYHTYSNDMKYEEKEVKTKYQWEEVKYRYDKKGDTPVGTPYKHGSVIVNVLNIPLIIMASYLYFPYTVILGFIMTFFRYSFIGQDGNQKRSSEILLGIYILIGITYVIYVYF